MAKRFALLVAVVTLLSLLTLFMVSTPLYAAQGSSASGSLASAAPAGSVRPAGASLRLRQKLEQVHASPSDGTPAWADGAVSALAIIDWYVDDDTCPALGLGTVISPYCKIQDAVDAAVDYQLIDVAAGTYTEPGIEVTETLTIQGAGAPTTTVQAAATQAVASDRVFTVTGSVHVTITEMTIRHGNVAGDGGGVYVQGWLTLVDTEVISNSATGFGADGGGAYVEFDATLSDGLFQDNYANKDGGGLYLYNGNLSMTGTQFISNTAGHYGGGAYVEYDATLNGGLFQDNWAAEHGGGLSVYDNLVMTDTQFISNTAEDDDGGGAYVYDDATLNGGLFQDNYSGRSGGGLNVEEGSLSMTDTQFISNTSYAYDGGGAYVYYDATLNGGLFQDNDAGRDGGGLYAGGELTVERARFLGNTAGDDGGGLAHEGSSSIVNSLFARNAAQGNGQAMYIDNIGDTLDIVHCTVVSPTTSGGTAIYLVSSNVNISNTIVANFDTAIENEPDSGTVNEDYNLFWPTGPAPWSAAPAPSIMAVSAASTATRPLSTPPATITV